MKYALCLVNLLFFLALYAFSSVGLAVFRTHSISVAAEIARADGGQDVDRTKLEKLILTTGNARSYYRNLSGIAALGSSINVIAIVVLLWTSKQQRGHRAESLDARSDPS